VDLHDVPVQALAVAKMKLSRLHARSSDVEQKSALAELGELVDRAYGAVRSLTFQLSPPILYDLGLLPALDWLAGDFQDRYHLEITLEDDGQAKPMDEPVRVILFRCVRELLINVVKHAGAREARIELRRDNDKLLVTVEDDGKGFELAAIETDRGRRGFGLLSIHERLANIGGLLKIRSSPGAGTAVTLEAPLRLDNPQTPEVKP
jgi:signal transduction histidine kinase